MGNEEKVRPGVRGTEWPTTPLLLEKTPKKHNILIGEDAMQVRFAEQFLSAHYNAKITCELMEILPDDAILGHEEPCLYRVDRPSQIELSPSVRARVGIWSLDLIEKGSAGVNAIVREACRIMKLSKPPRQALDYVAAEVAKNLYDIKAGIWHAAWLLSGPIPERKTWPNPWENYITWLPVGEDPQYRLNTLYWTLVEYVFAAENDDKGFRKTGRSFRPREFKYLSSLVLPKVRVFDSLAVLSAWRAHRSDPYVVALKLTKIWERR
jgi:hypothetical protein